ncbi:MAG: hypothetical protein ACR2IE_10490 [Candidatus Sumerlaeaceae bacterium]
MSRYFYRFTFFCAFYLLSCGPAFAATLLSDTFSSASLDSSKYAILRSSNASVSGGSLIDVANIVDIGMEVPSYSANFPNTVQVDCVMKIPDPTIAARINNSVPETNAGFRVVEAGPEGIGIEIFPFRGASDVDTLNIRRAVNWGNDVSANISPQLTPNQLVVLRGIVNGANVTATLYDFNTSAVLATLATTTATLQVNNTAGALRLTTYNQANVEFLSCKATNTANSNVLIDDTFNGTSLNLNNWWPAATDEVSNVSPNPTTGTATLIGYNGTNLTALLPTKQTFSNFEMQSVFKMSQRGPNGYGNFSVQFRETDKFNALYQLAVFPQTGSSVGDGVTTYTTPCIVLRKGTAPGAYTNLGGKTISEPTDSSTLVVNLIANGSAISFYTGPTKTAGIGPVVSVTDSSNTSGFVKFTNFALTAVDLDEYQIATIGSNIVAPITTAASDEWMLMQ